MDGRSRRILVVSDHVAPIDDLLDAIHQRAVAEDVQFRLVVLNPARSEVHLLHPERHDRAVEAELTLLETLPVLEELVGRRIIGSVSIRHDPMDAIEETIHSEPVDEIMLAVPQHRLASRLHQDLPHRLAHLGMPVTVVPSPPAR